MIVRRFFEPLLAQTSYLIGCGAAGEAIVVDPNRDADQYVSAAESHGLRISHVTETHIHADFLSGSRELAARTGATLCVSAEGGPDWTYDCAAEARVLHDRDRITIGNVSLDVEHTPGHTPEHLTFLITDGAVANQPIAAATGDFLFVGDVGRPDLLEKAVHLTGTMEASARTLYRSLCAFNRHEEWLQIWPGHGAGSSCGKGISAVPHSTLGYERRFNWAFKAANEDTFVAQVLEGQPDPPTYFATMKRMNKAGPRILGAWPTPPRHPDAALPDVVGRGDLVIDMRPAAEYAAGFLPGTLNLPLTSSFVTWAGWLVPYDRDFHVLLGEHADSRLPEIVRALALIGLDRLAGYFAPSALSAVGSRLETIPQVRPADLAAMRGDRTPVVVDVRHDNEWTAGHLPAAVHLPLGHLEARLRELPREHPLVTQCQSGARSAIAASLLRRAGFSDVRNLAGGYEAWTAAGLPTCRAAD
jgi:hydroxyacylglutathione hydrolase